MAQDLQQPSAVWAGTAYEYSAVVAPTASYAQSSPEAQAGGVAFDALASARCRVRDAVAT